MRRSRQRCSSRKEPPEVPRNAACLARAGEDKPSFILACHHLDNSSSLRGSETLFTARVLKLSLRTQRLGEMKLKSRRDSLEQASVWISLRFVVGQFPVSAAAVSELDGRCSSLSSGALNSCAPAADPEELRACSLPRKGFAHIKLKRRFTFAGFCAGKWHLSGPREAAAVDASPSISFQDLPLIFTGPVFLDKGQSF